MNHTVTTIRGGAPAGRSRRLSATLVTVLLLAGCDRGPDAEAIARYAVSALPADPELAEIYQRSCQACHSRGTSDAPLVGDQAAWQPRLEQGMDTLLNHVVEGVGGMPPYGLCMDCNAAEFERLIRFMSRHPDSP
ncbi:MAG: c-type cytochrome [Marinobacter sp.]|uniref:c-type cytochrome n=1 Tax=Marinobacter sp. TaxID=50741 RepID=UPI00299D5F10|nr:c-type cytochrome [Marinobacter sp.]MDX1756038.1 c-type cytochrome [Marinobacter sp.]